MNFEIYKETIHYRVWIINKEFYLVVPRIRENPSIEVVIDDEIDLKLEDYLNTVNIGVIRVFAANYFEGKLSDEISRIKLKTIINKDVSIVRRILNDTGIEYKDEIKLKTPFKEFGEWYFNEINREQALQNTSRLDPITVFDSELNRRKRSKANISRILELRRLKEELKNHQGQAVVSSGEEKGNAKKLSNGHSLLDEYKAAFVNIMFLSFIVIIVTMSWLIIMFMNIK